MISLESSGRLFIDLPVLQQYAFDFTRVPAGYLQTCLCSSNIAVFSLESRQAIYRPAGALTILQCFHQSPGRLFIDLPVLQQYAYDFNRVQAGYLQTCRCSSNIAVFSLESRQAIYRSACRCSSRLFIDLPVLQQYCSVFTRVPAGYLQICRCSSNIAVFLLQSRHIDRFSLCFFQTCRCFSTLARLWLEHRQAKNNLPGLQPQPKKKAAHKPTR